MAVSFLLVAGSFSSAAPALAAPAFNTFPISYTQTTDRDMPMIDARNVTQNIPYSTSQADHDNGVTANAGDIIEFQIYYHNSSVAEDIATNVIIAAQLPSGSSAASAHTVSASIRSDQTSSISSSNSFYGGNMTVNVAGGAQTLGFMPGSVRHFPNRTTTAQTPGSGDSLVNASGLNIGSVAGCFDFSGFVSFRAQVGNVTTTAVTRDLTIAKRVLNVTRTETTFVESVTAPPSQPVKF